MTQREVVRRRLLHQSVPYTPWAFGFTHDAHQKLAAHFGTPDLEPRFQNHILGLGGNLGPAAQLPHGRIRDYFGVVWDRSVDQDIGVVANCRLPEPTLKNYTLPDPVPPGAFDGIPQRIAQQPDKFRMFNIGFSLYERAWTLRGMENLMCDFVENPKFVHELLNAITDWNIAQVRRAVEFDIDAVHFGDDWGQQHGLQMGYETWKTFIFPCLKRLYAVAKKAGKFVTIHSCGDVDELFPDLVSIGLDCFNPFQPEVMDVFALLKQYHGKLAFHGGLSTQRTLPYGTPADVRQATQALLDAGHSGGYLFAPAHAVPKDVPLENLLAFIETVLRQPGAPTA